MTDSTPAEKAAAPGSALVDMAIDRYVAMLDRQNKYLREELARWRGRMMWLHDCTNGSTDAEGFEWGIYRVKWENGRAVEVWQTNADFSDLDAEMLREQNAVDNKLPRPSVTFEDEHRPHVQTYKAVWRDSEDAHGHEAGFNISPMLQKWICEAMEHIYNGGPPPTMEPYVGTLGPRRIVSPNT